jgi:hypothetical protein
VEGVRTCSNLDQPLLHVEWEEGERMKVSGAHVGLQGRRGKLAHVAALARVSGRNPNRRLGMTTDVAESWPSDQRSTVQIDPGREIQRKIT